MVDCGVTEGCVDPVFLSRLRNKHIDDTIMDPSKRLIRIGMSIVKIVISRAKMPVILTHADGRKLDILIPMLVKPEMEFCIDSIVDASTRGVVTHFEEIQESYSWWKCHHLTETRKGTLFVKRCLSSSGEGSKSRSRVAVTGVIMAATAYVSQSSTGHVHEKMPEKFRYSWSTWKDVRGDVSSCSLCAIKKSKGIS